MSSPDIKGLSPKLHVAECFLLFEMGELTKRGLFHAKRYTLSPYPELRPEITNLPFSDSQLGMVVRRIKDGLADLSLQYYQG